MPRRPACWARSIACRRRRRRSARARPAGWRSPAIPGRRSRSCPGSSSAFVAERPGVSVRLISRHSDVVSQLLPTESFDIGIAELPLDETAVKLVRYQMRCVAILPPRHPLASRKVLTPALLSGQPMVAPARSLQMPTAADRGLRRGGCAAQRRGRGRVLREPVRAGRGRHRLVAGRSAVGRELRPSRPGGSAVRAGDPLRDRRFPSPRPRALGAGGGVPRFAGGKTWRADAEASIRRSRPRSWRRS